MLGSMENTPKTALEFTDDQLAEAVRAVPELYNMAAGVAMQIELVARRAADEVADDDQG